MKKIFKIVLFILIITFLFTAFVFAEGHGAHGGDHLKRQLWDFVWRIINFGILIFLLYKVGKKPFQQFLHSRREKIEQAIKEAEYAKKLAEDRVKEYEEKIKNLEKEKQEILEKFKKEGEAEKERIIANAKIKAAKIVEQAKIMIAQELEKEKEMLKREATEKVINLATELIKKNLTAKDHKKIIKDSIERMVS